MLRSQTPLLGLQTRKNVLVETRGPDPSSLVLGTLGHMPEHTSPRLRGGAPV